MRFAAVLLFIGACGFKSTVAGDIDAAPMDGAESDAAPPPSDSAPAKRATEGLQNLWGFTEGTGTTVRDTAPFADALPLVISSNGSAVTWSASGGLTFASPGGYAASGPALIRTVDTCNASDAATLEAWFTPATINSPKDGILGGLVSNINSRDVDFYQAGASIRARVRTQGLIAGIELSAPGLVVGKLTHVAVVADGTSHKLYVDGVMVDSKTTAGPILWERYRFFAGGDVSSNQPFKGTLHLFAIYCKALSATQVADNFAAKF